MREMTRRILLGSLRRRKGRVVVSVSAIALGVSLVVAAINLHYGVTEKFAEELRNYGANLVLVPRTEPFLRERDLTILQHGSLKDRLVGYAPFLHRVVKVQQRDVVLAGAVFSRVGKLSPWWQVEGRWPQSKDEALAGFNAASKLGLRVGDRAVVSHKNSSLPFVIVGLLRTGGAEEHQIFVSLESVQRLTGLSGLLSSVLVSSRAEHELDETVAFLRRAWPEAEARTLWQVARAEEAVLSRIRIFLTLVSLLILFASGLSVFATMSTAALERKVEMALMRALGAKRSAVAWIFGFEAVAVGLIGGILGSALGLVFAQVIGLSVFNSFVFPKIISLPAGLILGLGVVLLSSRSAVRKTATMAPAPVLRGE